MTVLSARARAVAGVVLAALVLGGCSTPDPAPTLRPWAPSAVVVPVDPVTAYARARLADMSLPEKVASLLMIHVPGTDPVPIRGVLDATGIAGVIYLGDNVVSVDQVHALSAALSPDADLPVLVAIDQEGGIVRRLPGDDGPTPATLRASDPSVTTATFAARAALVAAAGVTINFGIIADTTADPGSFIFSRVLGTDPQSAAVRVAAAVAGERGVVLSTLKHFPGHGSFTADSHTSVPTIAMGYAEWEARDAPPFRAGIAAGAEFVMLGHLRFLGVDSAPATLSAEWVRILRHDLGFDGVIVTDDMTMLENSGDPAYADQAANAVAAVAAGDTLLLYVGPVDIPGVVGAIVAAVGDGRISEAAIDDAALRLLEVRRAESGRTGPYLSCGAECRTLID